MIQNTFLKKYITSKSCLSNTYLWISINGAILHYKNCLESVVKYVRLFVPDTKLTNVNKRNLTVKACSTLNPLRSNDKLFLPLITLQSIINTDISIYNPVGRWQISYLSLGTDILGWVRHLLLSLKSLPTIRCALLSSCWVLVSNSWKRCWTPESIFQKYCTADVFRA